MHHADIDPSQLPDEPFGLFYAWWRGDDLPEVAGPTDMEVRLEDADHDLSDVSGISLADLRGRQRKGHRPYVACIGGEIAGWGWSATAGFEIGELGISASLPHGNRYLWDFVTLPAWRGQGIYPALIQAMLQDDTDADRFWVGHDAPNVASGRGITKAGFQKVGEVYVVESKAVYVPVGPEDRAREAASMLGLPLFTYP
jgi:GNAT superfamily N-acetyltransferase